MLKKSTEKYDGYYEIIISDTDNRKDVSRALTQGKLRKLASRLYTSNLNDAPEVIVKRNLWQIVGQFVPNALIADRTAIELKPAPDGSIFIIADWLLGLIEQGTFIDPSEAVFVILGEHNRRVNSWRSILQGSKCRAFHSRICAREKLPANGRYARFRHSKGE